MTYTKAYAPERYARLGSAAEKLAELAPGEKLRLTELADTKEIEELRWLLYDLLHHLGLKSQFRVKTDYEAREIVVQRRRTATARVSLELGVGLDEGRLRELVLLGAEDAAQRLSQWLEAKEITLGEASRLSEALERVMR
jgi:hypothetical protein